MRVTWDWSSNLYLPKILVHHLESYTAIRGDRKDKQTGQDTAEAPARGVEMLPKVIYARASSARASTKSRLPTEVIKLLLKGYRWEWPIEQGGREAGNERQPWPASPTLAPQHFVGHRSIVLDDHISSHTGAAFFLMKILRTRAVR
jgi:hypothetical protein